MSMPTTGGRHVGVWCYIRDLAAAVPADLDEPQCHRSERRGGRRQSRLLVTVTVTRHSPFGQFMSFSPAKGHPPPLAKDFFRKY